MRALEDSSKQAVDRKRYPSDLTDAEWETVEPLLPITVPRGQERVHARREIVNAILYVHRSGCTWRMLPHDLPPWQTVYSYFRAWRDDATWPQIQESLRRPLR